MSTATTKPQRRRTQRVLGSYPGEHGTRRLCARHSDDETYLTDEPVSGRGVIYAVDTIPDGDGAEAIDALAAMYLQQARQLRSSPMAHTALDSDLHAADLWPDVLWAVA
jgi:hypothetical protein